jgi:hypothetical protein
MINPVDLIIFDDAALTNLLSARQMDDAAIVTCALDELDLDPLQPRPPPAPKPCARADVEMPEPEHHFVAMWITVKRFWEDNSSITSWVNDLGPLVRAINGVSPATAQVTAIVNISVSGVGQWWF